MFSASSDDDACDKIVTIASRDTRGVKKRRSDRDGGGEDTYRGGDNREDVDTVRSDIKNERRKRRRRENSTSSSSSNSIKRRRRRRGERKNRRVENGGGGVGSTRTEASSAYRELQHPPPPQRSCDVDSSVGRTNEEKKKKTTTVRVRRVDRSAAVTTTTAIRPTVACDTANEMVRQACLNIHNTDSIDVMEWSEAVLLCLASPHVSGALDGISWADVLSECAVYEWTVTIAAAIKLHLSRGDTLVTLFKRNRLEKVKSSYLKSEASMFCTKPRVDTTLLRQFRPPIHSHTHMKLNTQFKS